MPSKKKKAPERIKRTVDFTNCEHIFDAVVIIANQTRSKKIGPTILDLIEKQLKEMGAIE